jgi:hypothetical protein
MDLNNPSVLPLEAIASIFLELMEDDKEEDLKGKRTKRGSSFVSIKIKKGASRRRGQ